MATKRQWAVQPAIETAAVFVLVLLAVHPAAAAPKLRPFSQLGAPVAQVDPCMRPLAGDRGGGPGQEILQLSPEDSSALLLALLGHQQPVWGAAFSANGNIILTKGFDGTRTWDAYSGDQISFLEGAVIAAVSPDGENIAATMQGEDGQLMMGIADAAGELDATPLPADWSIWYRDPMQFTPDAGHLVLAGWDLSAGAPGLLVWDVARGSVVQRLVGTVLDLPLTDVRAQPWADHAFGSDTVALVSGGHADMISDIAISPDGRSLASASWDGTVRIWNLRTGKTERCLEVDGHVHLVDFSPNGRELATISSHWVAVDTFLHRFERWRLSDGRRQAETQLQVQPGQSFNAVEFGDLSPDLAWLALPAGKSVQLWDMATGDLAGLVRQPGDASSAEFGPDGDVLVTGYNYQNDITESTYGALLWDATHPDLAAGAATEKLVLEAVQLFEQGNSTAARRILRRAVAANPFPWYDPQTDAEVRAGLAEADDGGTRGTVRAGGKLNARAKPQPSASLVGQIPDQSEIKVFARSPDSQWLYVAGADTDGMEVVAWVAARFVVLEGSVQNLPIKQP